MLMRSSKGDIALAIDSIVGAQRSHPLENPISDGSISHGRVDNHIDNTIIGIIGVPDDEGSRVDSLAEAGANLTEACIALEEKPVNLNSPQVLEEAYHKLDLNNGPSKFKLAPGIAIWRSVSERTP